MYVRVSEDEDNFSAETPGGMVCFCLGRVTAQLQTSRSLQAIVKRNNKVLINYNEKQTSLSQ